ncbi:MAG: hypothetical protein D6685_10600 [Bacteroidetes bacterium]|nr:hypothetical protein AWN76_001135 [Rhodothermaceae bacterium RA]RMH60106.1 MAG: hypothetical protein D6685_10600 [Bacteroidota bacterium]
MHDIFSSLTLADYTFLVALIQSPFNLTDDRRLQALLATYEQEGTEEARAALNRQLERELRYLGSADVAYFIRYVAGRDPGAPFQEIVRDVARALKVELPPLGTERDLLEHLVQEYATQQFARLSPEAQQNMLVSLGVEQERAAAFIRRSAGVFAVPALIQAFDLLVVQGLIKNIVFGTISRIIGRQLSQRLFGFLAGRFPWWLRWVGPVSWGVSAGWAFADLQGPAQRKIIPAMLYLGVCSLRERQEDDAGKG